MLGTGSKIEDSAGLGVFVCVGGGGGEFEKKRAKKCKKTQLSWYKRWERLEKTTQELKNKTSYSHQSTARSKFACYYDASGQNTQSRVKSDDNSFSSVYESPSFKARKELIFKVSRQITWDETLHRFIEIFTLTNHRKGSTMLCETSSDKLFE